MYKPLSAIQLSAVIALLISTTIHWSIVILQRITSRLVHPNETAPRTESVFEQCMGTATLTVNVRYTSLPQVVLLVDHDHNQYLIGHSE